MEVKKSHLTLGLIILGLIIIATLGFRLWNNQILSSLGSLSQFSLYLILAFSLFAGIVSFFSPCGLALLPAFISYNMAMIDNGESNKNKILKIGLFSALGIITFYIILGILFSLLGALIAPYIQIFQYIIAVLFILFGIMLIRKFSFSAGFFEKFKRKVHEKALKQSGYRGFYIFGFAYGLDIIGCLFPLIAALILIPIATGRFTLGISAFLAYSVGIAVMITIFAYLISYSRNTLVSDVLKSTEKIKTLAGIGLIIGGLALLYYYAFYGMAIG